MADRNRPKRNVKQPARHRDYVALQTTSVDNATPTHKGTSQTVTMNFMEKDFAKVELQLRKFEKDSNVGKKIVDGPTVIASQVGKSAYKNISTKSNNSEDDDVLPFGPDPPKQNFRRMGSSTPPIRNVGTSQELKIKYNGKGGSNKNIDDRNKSYKSFSPGKVNCNDGVHQFSPNSTIQNYRQFDRAPQMGNNGTSPEWKMEHYGKGSSNENTNYCDKSYKSISPGTENSNHAVPQFHRNLPTRNFRQINCVSPIRNGGISQGLKMKRTRGSNEKNGQRNVPISVKGCRTVDEIKRLHGGMMRENSVADVEVNEHSAFIADLLELFVLKVHCLQQRLERMENPVAQELSFEFPTKPDCLPLKTRRDIEEFEDVGSAAYKEVVTFLGSLSIGDLKQTTNLILKHAISNSLAAEVTWQEGEPGTVVLQRTRFAKALYAASARNKVYDKSRWEDFSIAITTALKAAKQRKRNSERREAADGQPAARRPRQERVNSRLLTTPVDSENEV